MNVGEVKARSGSAPMSVVVEVPVEHPVPAGFGRPGQLVEATVQVRIYGKLDGSISASAVVERGRAVEAESPMDEAILAGALKADEAMLPRRRRR